MKKFILVLIFTIVIISLTLIYDNNNTKSNNDKIVLSEVTHSVFYAPLYVSIEKGYFKNEGIDIELLLTQGADKVATSVLSGDANIGFSGPEATIYLYNSSKEKLKTFAYLTKRDGQFIVGDCKYKDNFKMENLKNKTVLAGRSGGMPLMMFEYALKVSNISKKDVNIDTSIEFASLTGAFISGNGDFVNLFEPNATKVEKANKGCVLASLGNITGIVPYTTFYAKEEYLNNNKNLIKRFNIALNKGLKYVKNNDSKKIAEAIQNQFKDTSLEELTTLVDRYKTADSWYETTNVNNIDFDKLQDILVYNKALNKKIDSNILLTNEYN